MKTEGLASFQSLRKSSLLDHINRQKEFRNQDLSGEEKKMISNKFTGDHTQLEFYEGSGAVRQEQPGGRGKNIDIKI
ncbi:MAG: hypothetical protein PVI44_11425 [Balneolaceae bacterium]|jgi:hypothetical protein